MLKQSFYLFLLVVFLFSCKTSEKLVVEAESEHFLISSHKEVWVDSTRNRQVPLIIYKPRRSDELLEQKLVIISHGYGFNKGNPYLGYSFIAEHLARKGYFVVSIQHELPSDELLAMDGDLRIKRKPNWEKGVQNILFVTNQLKGKYPVLNHSKMILIGHSNGGDMSVLFAEKYPEITDIVITLDHRRMPIPRVKEPKFYSLRSNDQNPDEGVLSTPEEQKKYGQVFMQTAIKHNDMCNTASHEERNVILSFIDLQLKIKRK